MQKCVHCTGCCNRYGKQGGKQRYKCKGCGKMQLRVYAKQAYGNRDLNQWIVRLIKEGCSIRGIARLLKISTVTLSRRIRAIARAILRPIIRLNLDRVEVDELKTFIRRKKNECWIAYALHPKTGTVIDYMIGRRTKKALRVLIKTLLLAKARRIHTDHLPVYRSLIPEGLHRCGGYQTNHIERHNLSVRTHLNRLSRKTICYSKSVVMLEACFRIYAWG